MDEKFTKYPDILQYDEFRDKTYNGILGDATIATKEKGEKIVNAGVNRIVDFMNNYFEM